MRSSAKIKETIEALETAFKSTNPFDATFSSFLRQRRYVGSSDRREITFRFWSIVRNFAKLCWHLNLNPEQKFRTKNCRILVIAHLVLIEKIAADLIIELFSDTSPYAPIALNNEEKDLITLLSNKELLSNETPENIRFELPLWLYEIMPKDKDCLLSLLEEAPIDLRVNTLKTKRDIILKALKDKNVECDISNISPFGIRLKNRTNLAKIKNIDEGLLEIQDEGSQIIALMTNATSNQTILDLCAGTGGKSLTLASMMNNKGEIVISDISQERLEKAKIRIEKAGVSIIKTALNNNINNQKFDCVLIDAPCSGTGIFRRTPDARWRHSPSFIKSLNSSQAELLNKAAMLVKNGGKIVYATCSFLKEENEEQIKNFMESNSSFKTINHVDLWQNLKTELNPTFSEYGIRLAPHTTQTDGYFISVLEKS